MIGTNFDSTFSPPKPNLTWNDWLKTLVELFVRLFELCLFYLIYQPQYLCCSTFLGDHYSRLFFPIWTAIHFHQHLNFKKTKTSFSLSLFVCLSVSLSLCLSVFLSLTLKQAKSSYRWIFCYVILTHFLPVSFDRW